MSIQESQQHASPGPAADNMDHANVIPDSQLDPETYQFPSHRLRRRQIHEDRTPLVLVACGSFRFVQLSMLVPVSC